MGFPILLGNVRGVLTAGHCGANRWQNNGNFSGQQYTTTWPHAADVRGDWQIIYNGTSTNATRLIWTGAIHQNLAPNTITAMQFNSYRAANLGLCVSGASTGSTCRYYVTHAVTSANIGGYPVYPVTRFVSDFNQNGVRMEVPADCGGATIGDSGGPVYFSNTTGVTGYGLVTAGVGPAECGTHAPVVPRTDRFPRFNQWVTTPVRPIKAFYPASTAIGGFSACNGAPCPPGG